MTGAAEMVAGAVVEHVAGKLSETTLERIGGMLWNFKDDVQDMKKQMGTLQVVLSYADKRSRGRGTTDDDALAQHWLKKYKSVAYDIEDAVDELGLMQLYGKGAQARYVSMTESSHEYSI